MKFSVWALAGLVIGLFMAEYAMRREKIFHKVLADRNKLNLKSLV